MKLTINSILITIIIFAIGAVNILAQIDSGTKIVTPSDSQSSITDISGDGRFAVIESDGDIATYNPRNSDGNREIFLFDYAQRRIFQITDTKRALIDSNESPTEDSNIKVDIVSYQPVISNDGLWISFSSNATTSTSASPNSTNPGDFDGNDVANTPLLQQDANLEIWLYQLPAFSSIDLTTGTIPAFVDLSIGSFIQVTNSDTTQLPSQGTENTPPIIAADNNEPSIDDTGSTVAFVSNRDLETPLNAVPDDNPEIFVYKRSSASTKQVTTIPRGEIGFPLSSNGPSISGNGSAVVFSSNSTNPVLGLNGCNDDFNTEIFLTNLNSQGGTTGQFKIQITNTLAVDHFGTNFLFSYEDNISRNGQYVVFTSRSNLDSDNSIEDGFAVHVYDIATTQDPGFCDSNTPWNPSGYQQVGPRGDADPVVPFSEDRRYPSFTDYDSNGTPDTLVLTSRLNFDSGGIIPANPNDGLNPSLDRPSKTYSFNFRDAIPEFTRITNTSSLDWVRGARAVVSNSRSRLINTIVDDIGFFEGGRAEAHYLFSPSNSLEDSNVQNQAFSTGGGGILIGSGSNEAVGLTPNMLGTYTFESQQIPIAPSSFANVENLSISRQLPAPIQYQGVSMTVDGVSAFVTGIVDGRINFVVPKEVSAGLQPVVINHNGVVIRDNLQIVSTSQPDVVTNKIIAADYIGDRIPSSGGRAYVLDVTDPNNPQTEPFTVTPQSKFRVFLTGVEGVDSNSITIQIGNETIQGSSILTNATEADYPGIFTFDFEMPSVLDGAGNVPVVVSVGSEQSHPATEAAHINIISATQPPTDLAVWRPDGGIWYILNGDGTNTVVQWGISTDTTAPGDYDGDGKTDLAIFRPEDGDWWVIRSSDSTTFAYHFGTDGDEVAQADYDGDGKTDLAVWRPSTGFWYILRSSDGSFYGVPFGGAQFGDIPVSADYDGDGNADIAVWRPSTSYWFVLQSTDSQVSIVPFGASGDKPVVGDYDGDGRADLATWRSTDTTWRILNSGNNQVVAVNWGIDSDFTVQGDYDSDGKTDIAVWRTTGTNVGWWYIRKSSDLQMRAEKWGTTGDIPVPAPYNRGS